MHSFDVEHRYVRTNGITLHVVFTGPEDGPPVLLLHGFPEFWYGWRHQIPFLAGLGFRVIVPDQRGYNLSDKPLGVAAYRLDVLVQDVVGLVAALGYQSVYLVGHDWGAAVAWWTAYTAPQVVRKLVILNVPFPTILVEQMQSGNWEQLRKSWYMFAFQLPWLPEQGFHRENKGEGRNILLASSRKGTFLPEELIEYERAWQRPGAVRAMINWYRAAGRYLPFQKMPAAGAIQTPTLMLWGERDVALGKELAPLSIVLCAQGELVFFPDASHWLQHDEAVGVNEQLERFLA